VVNSISVVLCTHNGAATIADQLDALTSQRVTVEWELVVVDNCSTDRTVEIVNRFIENGAACRIVDARDQRGLAYARNVGARAARFPIVAFCDDDDIVGDGWIDALAAGVARHRFAASRMEYDRLNPPETMMGRSAFQQAELSTMFGYRLSNGALAIERALWDQVGGNDESLVRTGEDFDFSIRVQRDCGVKPVLVPDAVYHYRQRQGMNASFVQGRAYGSAHVLLYRRYGRESTEVGRERVRALHDWGWLITRAPLVLFSSRRSAWARRLGLRVGRLGGSLQHRVWYP
jgi:glycosyltransferase involved in cell wall biosynthesis